jgi:hypothetical protein
MSNSSQDGTLTKHAATKVMPGTSGYDATGAGIKESLKKLGLGA